MSTYKLLFLFTRPRKNETGSQIILISILQQQEKRAPVPLQVDEHPVL